MSDEARAWAKRQAVKSIAAKSVLNALAGYADADGQAWPKLSTLAEVTGMSQRHVRRQLEKLETDGLLTRDEQYRQSGGNTSNLYTLAIPGEQLVGGDRADAGVRPLSAPGGQSCPTVGTSSETSTSDEVSGACARAVGVAAASDPAPWKPHSQAVAVPPKGLPGAAGAEEQARWVQAQQSAPRCEASKWLAGAYVGALGKTIYLVVLSDTGADELCRNRNDWSVLSAAWRRRDPLGRSLQLVGRKTFAELVTSPQAGAA